MEAGGSGVSVGVRRRRFGTSRGGEEMSRGEVKSVGFHGDNHRTVEMCSSVTMTIRNHPTRAGSLLKRKTEMPLQLLLPPAACATAAAATALSAFSRPRPFRLRGSHIPFAFPRLRKYGRRHREPVTTLSFDDDDAESEAAEDDEDDEEEAVDEEEFLATRPKPVGFGAWKTYSTDIEEQLLREMGVGGARRKDDSSPGKRRVGSSSDKEISADLNDGRVQVRVWNLPKKKNIHKDLKQAFKGFPGLVTINPAVSANKKTRDPICKGFAYLKMESVEAATRFVEIYSHKNVSFGKVEKPISCCVVDAQSSTEPLNKGASSQEIQQSKLKHQNLVAAS